MVHAAQAQPHHQQNHQAQPHNSQKWIYKIKLLQIIKVITSNCCLILFQLRLFDLIVKLNMLAYFLSFI